MFLRKAILNPELNLEGQVVPEQSTIKIKAATWMPLDNLKQQIRQSDVLESIYASDFLIEVLDFGEDPYITGRKLGKRKVEKFDPYYFKKNQVDSFRQIEAEFMDRLMMSDTYIFSNFKDLFVRYGRLLKRGERDSNE